MTLSIASFGQGLGEYIKKKEQIGCQTFEVEYDTAKIQELISFHRGMLVNDSTDYKILYIIATDYQRFRFYDSAKIYAQKSINLKTDFSSNYALLATIYYKGSKNDSAAFYYDLASKYETDIAQKKKYKFIVANKYIKEEKFAEAYNHTKELLVMDSLDLKSRYYYIKLSNIIGLYQESKEKALASLKSFDFENRYKDSKTKFLLELLIALFELNDMKNFEKYWEQMQNASITSSYIFYFLKYTCLAGYENRLNESFKMELNKRRNSTLASAGDYFFQKQNHEKARFYWNQIGDEALKEKLLNLLK